MFKEFGVSGTGAHSVQVSPEKDERHKPHHDENGQQATPGQEHAQVVTCTSVGEENTMYYTITWFPLEIGEEKVLYNVLIKFKKIIGSTLCGISFKSFFLATSRDQRLS